MHPLVLFRYCPRCGSSRFEEHNEKAKKCRDCGFVYYFNSCSATVALILNSRNELLVTRRAKEPAKGTFDLPGGFIDMYETGEEGVAREVKEETGIYGPAKHLSLFTAEYLSVQRLRSAHARYVFPVPVEDTCPRSTRRCGRNVLHPDRKDRASKIRTGFGASWCRTIYRDETAKNGAFCKKGNISWNIRIVRFFIIFR
ncbi:MAG: NUDIX domain-containing protein [Alistipes indistinctus]